MAIPESADPGVGRPGPSLSVYLETPYERDAQGLSSDNPFLRFVLALEPATGRLTLIGRVSPAPGRSPYAIPAQVGLTPLPYYPSMQNALAVLRSAPAACATIWRALASADVVWSIGPHPMSIPVAVIGVVRRKRVVLGVRQHFPDYVRHRSRPATRWLSVTAAWTLEAVFRLLARRLPTVVVGPDLARRYRARRAPRCIATTTLLTRPDVMAPRDRPFADGGVVELLSVGRLDPEKAPELLLRMMDELAKRRPGTRVRLTVAGSGPLEASLREEAGRFGGTVRILGHVASGPELVGLYRSSDLLVHTARTEGLPAVLAEAQALGLPVVATGVGGVSEALGHGSSGLVVPPNDPARLAESVLALIDDPGLRERLVAAGLAATSGLTLEDEAARVAAFILGT